MPFCSSEQHVLRCKSVMAAMQAITVAVLVAYLQLSTTFVPKAYPPFAQGDVLSFGSSRLWVSSPSLLVVSCR